MSTALRSLLPRVASLSALAVAIGGCDGGAGPGAQSQAPPPEVRVVVAESAPARNLVSVPGRIQAVRTAEVRARVNGIVQRRLYEEGSDVEEGQDLFLIDPREMRAALSAAEATLARAQAGVANSRRDVERYTRLLAQRAISEQEYDAALARVRTGEADVAQAEAQVEGARLNLSYTTVKAPIAGRAGRAQVTEGALVSGTSATLLTTIEQLDPVYVNFSQSSADLLRIRREMAQGSLQIPELQEVAATLVLEDESRYPHAGHLDFLDMAIDEATGTVALRAEFPNPDRLLLPGQFVRAEIDAGVRPGAMLIPQRAVQLSGAGAAVMTVAPNGVAAPKPVTVGSLQGGAWLVLSGLEPGDRVIVDGLQQVRPGQPVAIAESTAAVEPPAAPSR